MGTGSTDEFRKDVVRIALTSGLSRRQVADDLGFGLSRLNTWVDANPDTDVVTASSRDPHPQGGEGHPIKPSPATARLCAVATACAIIRSLKGHCRWLIGGSDPVKNVAHGLMRS